MMERFLRLPAERIGEIATLTAEAAKGDEAALDRLAELPERELHVAWRVLDQRRRAAASDPARPAPAKVAEPPEARGRDRITAALAGGRGA